MQDELGDRMKNQYENRTRFYLPRRTYSILRLDGRAFHTYTRAYDRPFDQVLADRMDSTAGHLCKEISGTKFAYVQSDEISLLLTDFETIRTSAWFDGNIQKVVSVAASMASAYFNDKVAFDARVFTIPDPVEVANYFVWRQKDAIRNAVQMAAQAHFSSKELHGLKTEVLLEKIEEVKPWAEYPNGFKRGRLLTKKTTAYPFVQGKHDPYERTSWVADAAPLFTEARHVLKELIPVMTNADRSI